MEDFHSIPFDDQSKCCFTCKHSSFEKATSAFYQGRGPSFVFGCKRMPYSNGYTSDVRESEIFYDPVSNSFWIDAGPYFRNCVNYDCRDESEVFNNLKLTDSQSHSIFRHNIKEDINEQ